uniref:Uncharacterized protein n=1 Tax=Anopheles funestus TaxID=62324 RepID=A0A182S094_ANOFN
MDQTIWNSYIVYTKQDGTKTHPQFRLDLKQDLDQLESARCVVLVGTQMEKETERRPGTIVRTAMWAYVSNVLKFTIQKKITLTVK